MMQAGAPTCQKWFSGPARPAASETWGLGVVPSPGVFTQLGVEGDAWPWWWARVSPDRLGDRVTVMSLRSLCPHHCPRKEVWRSLDFGPCCPLGSTWVLCTRPRGALAAPSVPPQTAALVKPGPTSSLLP